MKFALAAIFFRLLFPIMSHEDLNFEQYQVALIVDGSKFCSGAVYNERFVMTASLCVKGAFEVDVIFGDSSISSLNVTALISTNIIVESRQDGSLREVALLRLPRTIGLGKGIQAVKMPHIANYDNNNNNVPEEDASGVGRVLEGQWVLLTGWTVGDRIARTLQILHTTLILSIECKEQFGREADQCVFAENVQDVGDLGSPLFSSEGIFLGFTLSKRGSYILFTDITQHTTWICDIVGDIPMGRLQSRKNSTRNRTMH